MEGVNQDCNEGNPNDPTKLLLALLGALCPIPEICGTEAEENRRTHADLAHMRAWELADERLFARIHLRHLKPSSPSRYWLRERLTRIAEEVRQRKSAQKEGRSNARKHVR